MDWFRMYGEMPDDPKIGTLTDSQFRTWVELLCAACKAEDNGNTKLTEKTINWALRRDVLCDVTELSQRGLVTINSDGEYIIKAWSKRQYKTDSSAERTRKYREKKKEESSKQAAPKACDVTVTEARRHGDCIDTDTEQIQNKETTLSGKPDAVTHESQEAIEYLNRKTKRNFRCVKANTAPVSARIREGFTLDDVKAVIDRQVRLWLNDPKMNEYLRPATLFAAKNFASYAGQTHEPDNWWSEAGFSSRFEAENAGCNQFIYKQFQDGKRLEEFA